MDPDLFLVLGLVIAVFAVPSVVSAITDRRTPRVAALATMVAGTFLVIALSNKPGGYAMYEIPDVFGSVINRYLN